MAFYLSLEPGHVCPFQNDGILLILCQACSLSSPHGGVSDGNHISSFGPSLTRNFYTTCGGLIKKKKKTSSVRVCVWRCLLCHWSQHFLGGCDESQVQSSAVLLTPSTPPALHSCVIVLIEPVFKVCFHLKARKKTIIIKQKFW